MDVPPNQEELDSAILNQAPGSPNYAILSFKSAQHGTQLIGALSATRADPLSKVDVPAFDWPAAEPPRLPSAGPSRTLSLVRVAGFSIRSVRRHPR